MSFGTFASGAIAGLCAAGLLALMGAAGVAQGQTPRASDPCRAYAVVSKPTLEERRGAIETSLATKRVQLAAFPTSGPQVSAAMTAARTALLKDIGDLEGNLIDTTFQLECLRADWISEDRSSNPIIEITNFYATNRQATGKADPYTFYGTRDLDTLHYGRITISVPASHTLGSLELPTWWKLERTPDPSKHFVIKSLTPLESDAARAQLRDAGLQAKSKALLLFVHGYNMTFADAALRTAQLAADLTFPGVVMFYSWPSNGDTKGYSHDEESVELAKAPMNELLDDIAGMPFQDVYILAHSMGNRLVTRVLAQRKEKGNDVAKVRDILLAAPDINAEIFKREIAPVLSTLTAARKTIYASSNDVALKASKIKHDYRRVGETSGGVFTHPGFETIDASKAAPLLRSFGHSYIFDSSLVLADLEDALINRRDVTRRRLKRAGTAPGQYWLLE